MPLARDQAWEELCEWTRADALRKHARASIRTRPRARAAQDLGGARTAGRT